MCGWPAARALRFRRKARALRGTHCWHMAFTASALCARLLELRMQGCLRWFACGGPFVCLRQIVLFPPNVCLCTSLCSHRTSAYAHPFVVHAPAETAHAEAVQAKQRVAEAKQELLELERKLEAELRVRARARLQGHGTCALLHSV